jgi:hypothetical protein
MINERPNIQNIQNYQDEQVEFFEDGQVKFCDAWAKLNGKGLFKSICEHLIDLKDYPKDLAEAIKHLDQQERQMIMTILKLVVFSQKEIGSEIPNPQDSVQKIPFFSGDDKDDNLFYVTQEKAGEKFVAKLRVDILTRLNKKLCRLELEDSNDDKKISSFWEKFSKGFQNLFCYRISSQDIMDRIKQIKLFQ